MDQDIKRIKDQDQQEDLEKEVLEVKAGKIEIATPELPVETLETLEKAAVLETPEAEIAPAAAVSVSAKSGRGNQQFGRNKGGSGGRGGQPGGSGGRRGGRGRGGDKRGEESDLEQKIVDLARVTRVMAGGKRMRFRACVVIGDRKGTVGLGLAKGKDVTMAISKAVAKARKDMVKVQFFKETIPFAVTEKFKAAKILLKPAKPGKGIIAGGALRVVFELAGVPNIVAKILGTNNQVSNAKAAMLALKRLADSVPGAKAKNRAKKKEVKVEIKSAEVKTEINK